MKKLVVLFLFINAISYADQIETVVDMLSEYGVVLNQSVKNGKIYLETDGIEIVFNDGKILESIFYVNENNYTDDCLNGAYGFMIVHLRLFLNKDDYHDFIKDHLDHAKFMLKENYFMKHERQNGKIKLILNLTERQVQLKCIIK